MKYTKPEVEITELEILDVIQTSSTPEEGGIEEGDNGTPGVEFGKSVPTI